MKLPVKLYSSILVAISLASCRPGAETPPPPPQLPNPNSGPGYAAADHKPRYGLDLFLQLARREQQNQNNLCVSPYSASMALSLVRPGARGETLRQIDRVIGRIDNINQQSLNTSLPLEVANRVYVANSIALKPEYKDSLPGDCLTSADFAEDPARACARINKWVSSHTRNRINNILAENDITPATQLILVNAISTKAKWQYPFEPEKTLDKDFHLETGRTITCPTLNATRGFRYLALPECEIIAIPFEKHPDKKDTCMIVILPEKGIAIRQYLAGLTPAALQNIRKTLSAAQPQTVCVNIPKFKTEYDSNLAGSLASIGMPDAFSQEKANFSGISDTPLLINFIKQNTWFEMKEEGVEAAAATAIGVVAASIEPISYKTPPQFKADRPFIWMIADISPDTTPYFIGILKDPVL